jgi:hypothetical protein
VQIHANAARAVHDAEHGASRHFGEPVNVTREFTSHSRYSMPARSSIALMTSRSDRGGWAMAIDRRMAWRYDDNRPRCESAGAFF